MTSIQTRTHKEPAAPAMQAVDGAELQQVDGGLALWFVFACGGLVGASAGATGMWIYKTYKEEHPDPKGK